MNNPPSSSPIFSSVSFIIGLVVVIILLCLPILLVTLAPLVIAYGYPFFLYAGPIIGLAGIVMGILGLRSGRLKPLAVVGVVLSAVWFVPAVFVFHQMYIDTPQNNRYAVCGEARCTTFSPRNAAQDIHSEEDNLQEALAGGGELSVRTPLSIQPCTISGAFGDEWKKTLTGTSASTVNSVTNRVTSYYQEKFDFLGVYEIETNRSSSQVLIQRMENEAYPERRIEVASSGRTSFSVVLRSACFEPAPEEYQTLIDNDRRKYSY